MDICALLIQNGAKTNQPNTVGPSVIDMCLMNLHSIEGRNEDGKFKYKVYKNYNAILCNIVSNKNDSIAEKTELFFGLINHDNTRFLDKPGEGLYSLGHLLGILIEQGVDVNAKHEIEETGRTALYYAAARGLCETAKTLIEKGAEVNVQDRVGKTPLHYAAENGHCETAKTLIEHKANVNAQDQVGRTALHYAAEKGDYKTVKALIQKGADKNITDKYGLLH